MTRRHVIVGATIMVLAVLVFIFYLSRNPPVEPDPPKAEASPEKRPGPAELSDYYERNGLVSKRMGSIRLYVFVDSEISLQRTVKGQSNRTVSLDRVPIRVVLENEANRALTLKEALNVDAELFTLTVSKLESDGPQEIFASHQLSTEISGWKPAEKKTFNIDWPLESPTPGIYLVSVTAGFGDHSTLQIRTTLK